MAANRYKIGWNEKLYPAIDITIFAGTDEELNITVCDTEFEADLLKHMEAQNDLADSAISQDEQIAYFIEPSEWSLSDEEIVAIVEKGYS